MPRRKNTPALACLMMLVPAMTAVHAAPSAKEIAECIVNESVQEFGKFAAAGGTVVFGTDVDYMTDADLVVLEADPAQDARRFAAVKCVVRAGKLIYAKRSAADPSAAGTAMPRAKAVLRNHRISKAESRLAAAASPTFMARCVQAVTSPAIFGRKSTTGSGACVSW
jgi:hypothetical protein